MTEPKEVTKLIREEYGRVRLRKRPIHPQKTKRQKDKNRSILMKDFKGVLIGLKAQKARGSEGFSRIILKKEKKRKK